MSHPSQLTSCDCLDFKQGKSSGDDGVSYEFLHLLAQTPLVRPFVELLNRVLHGLDPAQAWLEGKLTFLPKIKNPKGPRICALSCLRQVQASALLSCSRGACAARTPFLKSRLGSSAPSLDVSPLTGVWLCSDFFIFPASRICTCWLASLISLLLSTRFITVRSPNFYLVQTLT